jgi:hypothetical protein
MRGLYLMLTVAAGVALLAACDGSSGTGFQTGVASASVDSILITSPTQEQGGTIPLSLQGSTAFAKQVPLTLVGEGIHQPGSMQVPVVGALFTWTASFTTCGGKATTTPAITLDYIDPNNTNPDPNHPGYSMMLATTQKSQIALFPQIVAAVAPATPSVDYPVGFPIPAPVPPATAPPAPSAATAQYCIVVDAHSTTNSTVGSTTVTVLYP